MYTEMKFENGGDMEVFFHLIVHCNDIPAMSSGGEAAKERLYIIPFMSTWVKNAPATREEQDEKGLYPRDNRFADNFQKGWGQALLWILVQYYPTYMKEGLNKPPIVDQVTKEYWMRTDKFAMYIRESIDYPVLNDGTPDDSTYITIFDMYKDYCLWFDEAFGQSKEKADRPTFQKEMEDRLGKMDGSKWVALALKKRGMPAEATKGKGGHAMRKNTGSQFSQGMGQAPIGQMGTVPIGIMGTNNKDLENLNTSHGMLPPSNTAFAQFLQGK
jgi:phage/plasmid-associated DNA primase